jgi:hypothetical protein
VTQLDRIEAMLAELLRRQTPPEALGRLWATFPWLMPDEPPADHPASAFWLAALVSEQDRDL